MIFLESLQGSWWSHTDARIQCETAQRTDGSAYMVQALTTHHSTGKYVNRALGYT